MARVTCVAGGGGVSGEPAKSMRMSHACFIGKS